MDGEWREWFFNILNTINELPVIDIRIMMAVIEQFTTKTVKFLASLSG